MHRSHRALSRLTAGAALLTALVLPAPAAAKSHLWDTLVVFSSADGKVQFINMFVSDPAGTGEWFFQGQSLTSNSSTYIFPNHLPMNVSTFERWVLIATQDYADLPNAPTPDYIIPPGFFDPEGDELRYRTTIDVFTIPAGAMPTDGVHALERDLSTPVNVGINFAGESGTVTVPAPVPALPRPGVGLAALLLASLVGLALLARAARAG
jgi:hypothetical protein